jgi:hypothetical protein
MKKKEPAVPHEVEPNEGGWYDVKSGNSGKTYRVTPVGGDKATCDCEAGKHDRLCSHVKAVIQHGLEGLERLKTDSALYAYVKLQAEGGNVRCIALLRHIAKAACNCGAIANNRAHSTDPWCPSLNQ